ncbi:flagellin N-terminal-like domain-containing protein [Haloplanus vescus]|uniref:Flagellin N-terminal-like domain-containing protein n=1 Tax=Haloplanus vescus TaxID=555874 RepID=A0A1H3YE90_9EURY|nr:type IV pilin N-terminal domain-containing protein [Haloplanus vescus]SEA09401.1 flagellin N-terminal-like domain-containing protein [Haloplanus vescus]
MDREVTAHPDDRGQSEVVGEILAVAMVVIVVTTAGAYLLSDAASPDEETLAEIRLDVDEERVALTHLGGESVATTDIDLVVYINGTQEGITWASGTVDGDGDARFDPGERWVYNRTVASDATVRVTLADTETGTLLLDRTASPSDRR